MSVARTRKTGSKPSPENDLPPSDTENDGPEPEASRLFPGGPDLSGHEEGGANPEETPAQDEMAGDETPGDSVADRPSSGDEPDSAEALSAPAVLPADAGRGGGFLPLLLGGVLAGCIGFAAAAYVIPRYLPTLGGADDAAMLREDAQSQTDRIAALEKTIAELRATVDAAAGSAASGDLAAEVADSTGRLDALATSVKGIEDRIGALDARLTKAETRPLTGDRPSASALEAVQNEIEAFRAEVAAQKQSIEAAKGEIAAAAQSAANAIGAVKADAESMRDAAEEGARNAEVKGAVARMKAALDSGSALDGPLADLAAAGIDVPADLKDQAQGVPTVAALRDSFPDAARTALAVSVQETAGNDVWSRITAFLRSQSGARSLAPRAGEDPDAILSRAEADLRAGDLQGTLDELKALPEAGQNAMAEWSARASRRIAAVNAAATLEQQVQ